MKRRFCRKFPVGAASTLLTALALFFAAAPCWGRIYEPEVPDELQ